MRTSTLACLILVVGTATAQDFILTRESIQRVLPRMARDYLKCEQLEGPEIQKLDRSYPGTTRERWTFKGCERQQGYQLIFNGAGGKESIENVHRETVPEQTILVVHGVIQGADRSRKMLLSSGYRADWSMESLADIDRLIEEHSKRGKPNRVAVTMRTRKSTSR